MTTRRLVRFHVHGIAQPKGSATAYVPLAWARAAVKANHAPRAIVTSANPHAKAWARLVQDVAQAHAAAGLFLGPVVLTLTFELARPKAIRDKARPHTTRPDLDKLTRCVLDALIGVLYTDDAQVVEIHARKRYASYGAAPRATITVGDLVEPAPAQLALTAEEHVS